MCGYFSYVGFWFHCSPNPLKLKNTVDTRPLLKIALEAGVAFMPGEAFFAESNPPHGYIRLNFSHTEPEKMVEGLRRLRKVLLDANIA